MIENMVAEDINRNLESDIDVLKANVNRNTIQIRDVQEDVKTQWQNFKERVY